MDAFSVSMANGLNEPHMNKGRVCTIAGIWWISGTYASDWLVLHTHDRGVFSGI